MMAQESWDRGGLDGYDWSGDGWMAEEAKGERAAVSNGASRRGVWVGVG